MTISPQDRTTPPVSPAPPSDLGFGSVVARESTKRFLNRDGSFNVTREGLSIWQSISPYHLLLTMSWLRFLALFVAGYLMINALFGLAYVACGPGTLSGIDEQAPGPRFARMFFFSVHTLGTIGGLSSSDLQASAAEFLVILNNFDETFSQSVHTRSSYKAQEVVFGAKFKSMFLPRTEDDPVRVDIREIDSYEIV